MLLIIRFNVIIEKTKPINHRNCHNVIITIIDIAVIICYAI